MRVTIDPEGAIELQVSDWPGFGLRTLRPVVELNGAQVPYTVTSLTTDAEGRQSVHYDFAGRIRLELTFEAGPDVVTVGGWLENPSAAPVDLGRVAVFETGPEAASVAFGEQAREVAMLVQNNYWGDMVPLVARQTERSASDGSEPNDAAAPSEDSAVASQNVWLAYDRASRQALLVGFLSNETWTGTISVQSDSAGMVSRFSVGFDGGDLLLQPGRAVPLEGVTLMHAADPFDLLDAYGDAVAREHPFTPLAQVPVSWCSWYPYRLSVSEDRVLADAEIAATRLKPLGLSIMELDLGWEEGNLPSTFTENERFPHGLSWLSERLGDLGFELGVWKAPFQISQFDPLAREHPEWLLHGQDGALASLWTWFWEPHGEIYALDLTHPEAQEWLRDRMHSLSERGVRYLKADFIGQPSPEFARRRHDRTIAVGAQTGRIGAAIIARELAPGKMLNCGGPEMPGTGRWPLLYTCSDTGNTGTQSWQFQRDNLRSAACHLWKNGRWGVLQPSCLCVGLPGTLEEARSRATVAFMAGGQVDISDTLASLPEDRWAVLEATLPPLGLTARAVDLFDPVLEPGTVDYTAQCSGAEQEIPPGKPHPAGSVWHLRIERDWDEWDLVAVFALDPGEDQCRPTRFQVPFGHLRLDATQEYWAYEFWSGQFLGRVPAQRRNAEGYEHPGDFQDLVTGDAPGTLDIAFTGPGVKLICLRQIRPHPWVAGSSFHQSCGAELTDVSWDPQSEVLCGKVTRPVGHSGFLVLAAEGLRPADAEVGGQAVAAVPSAGGAWRLPVTCREGAMSWWVRFERE